MGEATIVSAIITGGVAVIVALIKLVPSRVDESNLSSQLADVRERLARVESQGTSTHDAVRENSESIKDIYQILRQSFPRPPGKR